MNAAEINYSLQKKLTIATLVIFIIKILAWSFTHSIAILTDTLEYTINVIAGFISLYSLYLSSLPKDQNHPYGHGKVEFLSAAVEAVLMIISSFFILYEGINHFVHPHAIYKLDLGILLLAFTAALNFIMGIISVRKGLKNKSLALVATGKHMKSDTYATVGVLAGLVILYFTGYQWIDSAVSVIFALIIIYTAYKILRSSVAGIMDEADIDLLTDIVKYLSDNRRDNWMDLHNLRIIKYGAVLHVDCHLTVPYYFTIDQGHNEVKLLEEMVRANFGETVEMFVHMDGCLYSQCPICFKSDCPVRKHSFDKRIEWTIENVSANHKHMDTQYL